MLASTVKNLLLVDIGFQIAFGAIVIAALSGIKNEYNQNETLSLSPSEASWLGKCSFNIYLNFYSFKIPSHNLGGMGYILQPIGCFISGFIIDPLGRKRAMIIVNIPFIIGWLTLYQSTSIVEIFIAYGLVGFGVGLVEAPVISYLGEIW